METKYSSDAAFNEWVRSRATPYELIQIYHDNPDLHWGWRMMAATLGEEPDHELPE